MDGTLRRVGLSTYIQVMRCIRHPANWTLMNDLQRCQREEFGPATETHYKLSINSE